jgi:hypothetical protein
MEKRIQSFLSLFNRKYHYAKTIPDITGPEVQNGLKFGMFQKIVPLPP